MVLEVVSPILGFESVKNFTFKAIDDNFAQIQSTNSDYPTFSMVNPFALRTFDFEVPDQVAHALELKQDSNYLVYCVMVVKQPFSDSLVNFLGPIVINVDTKKMAQVALDDAIYTTFGAAEPLSNYTA